jgi:hypothetical protein
VSGFDTSQGTTQQAFAIGGPNGPSIQSDPYTQALNLLSAAGVLVPTRVGWAVDPNDAVSLYQLRAILVPSTFVGDPLAGLIAPV